jgi:hypothetical protein
MTVVVVVVMMVPMMTIMMTVSGVEYDHYHHHIQHRSPSSLSSSSAPSSPPPPPPSYRHHYHHPYPLDCVGPHALKPNCQSQEILVRETVNITVCSAGPGNQSGRVHDISKVTAIQVNFHPNGLALSKLGFET